MMLDQGSSDMGAELWFALAVAAPQVLGAALYRAAKSMDPAARRTLAPIPLAALAVGGSQVALGVPEAMLAAPASVALAGGFVVLGAGRPGRGAAPLALGLLVVWSALVIGPAMWLGLAAEFGPLVALLTGLAALAALGPRLVGVCAGVSREPPLPWFLWSASYGGWALMAMFADLAWPFLVFPFLAQALTLGIGLFALEGGREGRGREGAAR